MSSETQQNENLSQDQTKTTLVSRNITVLGHRTSIRLEPEMWKALKEVATREKCTIHDLCTMVSIRKHADTSLTAAIRVFIMLYYRSAATEEGHKRAGHGDFNAMKQRARITHQAINYFAQMKQQAKQNPSGMPKIRGANASAMSM